MKVIEPKWLKEGGYIPKYQNPSGTLPSYHGRIKTMTNAEWEAAWRAQMRKYLNSETKLYDFTPMLEDIQNDNSFINWDAVERLKNFNYELNGKTLFADDAKTNDVDYTEWNKLFNETGLNKYFGYNPDVLLYYGPTTAARRDFLELIIPPINPPDEKIPPVTPPEITKPPLVPPIDNPYKPKEYTKKYPYRRQTFTDWIPTTLNAIGDVLTAGWNREEDLKKRFPLFEGPHRQAKVTNGYVARLQQQQLINNLLNLAQLQMGSNLNKNKEIIKTYNDYAQNAVNLMALTRANEFARTTDIANLTSNWNNELGVQVRNLNNKSNAAAMNNIVLANLKYNTSMNTALLIAGDKLYNDTTKYWLQESLNKAVHDYLNAKIDIENKRNKAYTDYLNLQDDPYSSKAYEAWKATFNVSSPEKLPPEMLDLNNHLKESWFRENWDTHESAAPYREAWQRMVERAGMDYARKSRDLDNQLLAAQNSAPLYFVGSLVPYYRNWGSKAQISPEFAKLGTKIVSKKRDNSVRMAEYHRKWLKLENEKMLRALKMSLEAMNKELDRLNKEQLVLLNAIFK